MKYRRLAQLRDYEINALLDILFGDHILVDIKRSDAPTELTVTIETLWESGKIEDLIFMTETDVKTHDIRLSSEDIWAYRQKLFALGVNPLTINNPYLKKESKLAKTS